jgi:hypothetical protein
MNLDGSGLNQLFNFEICFKAFLFWAVSTLLSDNSRGREHGEEADGSHVPDVPKPIVSCHVDLLPL